jgi:hypothetical protein
MKLSWKTYSVLGAVWVASFALAWMLRANGTWQAFFATPGVLALIGVLYQLVRDEAAHVKALAIQHDQQRFALGITSHMANVAFDRHAALCEEFVQELFLALHCLMNNPQDHEAARARANAIGDAIRKHAVWITPELQAQLEKFENAVRQIASKAFVAARHPSLGDPMEPIDLIFQLIDSGSPYGEPPKRDLLYRKIIDHARKVLGVKELTDLRVSLLQRRE